MAHVIQPILIAGTKYCPVCQGGRVTKGVATDILADFGPNGAIIHTDCGPWQLAEVFAGPGLWGEISIGVTCVASITALITPHYDPMAAIPETDLEVFIDGVSEEFLFIGADPYEYYLSISPSACGAVVTFQVRNGAADTVDLAITAVT